MSITTRTITFLALVILFFSATATANTTCPLEGVWKTDIERSANSVWQSTKIEDNKKEPIISILDEFEWVITCDSWTLRHVGDHEFPKEIEDEVGSYTWERISDNVLSVTTINSLEEQSETILEFDEIGCIKMYDQSRDMTEYKCKVQ